MLCFIGSFMFYFFLATADDVNDLILSRMAGVFMHAFHGKLSLHRHETVHSIGTYCK